MILFSTLQLEDVDIDEMTTRISAGLKTWLNFGVTVAGNPKQQATFEPTPHAETHSQLKKMWSEQSAKLGKIVDLNIFI